MQLQVDLVTGRVTNWAGSTLAPPTKKRRSKFFAYVRFAKNGIVEQLPVAATGFLGVKKKGGADFISHAASWDRVGYGRQTMYAFYLNLFTDEIEDEFPENNTPLKIDCELELRYQFGEVDERSATIPLVIEKTVVLGDEGFPVPGDFTYPAPEDLPISDAAQTALNLKSPLHSPLFTGIPSGPTAALGTNTTQFATTAFVQAEISTKADLDDNQKILLSQLPDSIVGQLEYKGSWNANTNVPAIPTATEGNKGHYYIVETAGTTEIDGQEEWAIGDWLVSNGESWDKIDNTDTAATETISGISRRATDDEVTNGVATTPHVTPATLQIKLVEEVVFLDSVNQSGGVAGVGEDGIISPTILPQFIIDGGAFLKNIIGASVLIGGEV